MSKNETKSITTATETIESTETAQAEQAVQIENVEVVAATETIKPTPAQVVRAVLASTFNQDAQVTAYQMSVVINLSLQILQIEAVDSKTGMLKLVQVAPQMIYSATKKARSISDRFSMEQAFSFCSDYVTRKAGGMVAQGERIDQTAALARAMMLLNTK